MKAAAVDPGEVCVAQSHTDEGDVAAVILDAAAIAVPLFAKFELTVEFVIVRVPSLKMPPPPIPMSVAVASLLVT